MDVLVNRYVERSVTGELVDTGIFAQDGFMNGQDGWIEKELGVEDGGLKGQRNIVPIGTPPRLGVSE